MQVFLFRKLSLSLLPEMITKQMNTSPIDTLRSFFCQMMPLNVNEVALVEQCFNPSTYKRRELLLRAGEHCRHYMFVVQGCLRMYSEDDKGDRHIIKFAPEGTWMTDIDSFFHRKPSRLFIDALEPTTVMQTELEPLVSSFTHSWRLSNIFRVLAENELALLQQRHLETLSSTAEERYQTFCDTYPQLMNRISQSQIAAYLGVSPEFLSRMKSKLLRHPKDVFLT